VWVAAQHQLRAQGTWKAPDRDLLEQYVRAVVTARQARRDAAERPIVEGPPGSPRIHPNQTSGSSSGPVSM